MRLVIATALTLAILAVFTVIGDGQDGGVKAKGKLPNGWKKLSLSAAQDAEVRKLSIDYGEKIAALQKQLDEAKREMRVKQVAVLTDAQKKILTSLPGDTIESKKEKETKKDPTP